MADQRHYLPPGPLVDVVNGRGGAAACLDRARIFDGNRVRLRDSLKHARHRGKISLTVIDNWCLEVLGVMPQDIYGEAWWTA